MNRSVMTSELDRCYICGARSWIEIHHVFGGANRKNSERYGLVVPLCHYCHNEPPNGVHFNSALDQKLKRETQERFETIASHDEFMKIFGRNYIL